MRKLLLLCAVCLLLVFPVVANATSITADLLGTRSTNAGGGLTATDGWSGLDGPDIDTDPDNNGFQISWDINSTGSGGAGDPVVYHYLYTISGAATGDTDSLSKGLSHWILEVTNPSEASDFTNVIPYFSVNDDGTEESPKQWDTSVNDNPNPYMPAIGIYGLKWDTTGDDVLTYSVSFDTEKDPVWGDFYAKDGFENASGVFATARNLGFGTDPTDTTTVFTNWIATPDGANGNGGGPGGDPIPEPATMLLLGSGLIGFAVSGRKKLKKRNG